MSPDQLDRILYIHWGILTFLMGLICGSFFNVCIYRIPARKSIVAPGSHCYSCGTFLKWYDNIPLLSYLLLQGNCRYCGSHFSPRYFGVELLTGVLFLFVYWMVGPEWVVLFSLIFTGLLIVGTFTDIDHYIIPDGITIGGLVFALVAALILGRLSIVASEYILARDIYDSFLDKIPVRAAPGRLTVFAWALVSAGFGWGLLAGIGLLGRLLFRKEAMGGGDVKLFAFLGAYLGAVNCLVILFLSAMLGTCIGLTLILAHKLFRKDEFEEIELMPDRRIAPALTVSGGNRDNLLMGDTSVPSSEALEETALKPISVQIARSTARQLHHFPFGPYIAVAAFLVMLFHDQVNAGVRDLLLLPGSRSMELYMKSAPASPGKTQSLK